MPGPKGSAKQKTKTRTGRPGSSQKICDLILLTSALSEAGATIDADSVAGRLGLTDEEARKLLYLLATSSASGLTGDPEGYLSLSYDDYDQVQLAFDTGVHGRAINLTASEFQALVLALSEAGLIDHELLSKQHGQPRARSDSDEALLATYVKDRLAQRSDDLLLCARAVAEGSYLRFSYTKPDEGKTTIRLAYPRMISKDEGRWHLDAQDLSDGVLKTFRLDRMHQIELIARGSFRGKAQSESIIPPETDRVSRSRQVSITFHSARPLDLFWWDGLQTQAAGSGDLEASLPYYGGSWLIRHLAACGSDVSIHDEEIAAKTRSYAARLLEAANSTSQDAS